MNTGRSNDTPPEHRLSHGGHEKCPRTSNGPIPADLPSYDHEGWLSTCDDCGEDFDAPTHGIAQDCKGRTYHLCRMAPAVLDAREQEARA